MTVVSVARNGHGGSIKKTVRPAFPDPFLTILNWWGRKSANLRSIPWNS
jgi:hypothetical protein